MCAHHIHVSRSVNVNREQHFTSAYRGPVTHTHTRTTYHIQTAHSYECRTGTVKHIYLINCTRVQVIVTHVKKYLYLFISQRVYYELCDICVIIVHIIIKHILCNRMYIPSVCMCMYVFNVCNV